MQAGTEAVRLALQLVKERAVAIDLMSLELQANPPLGELIQTLVDTCNKANAAFSLAAATYATADETGPEAVTDVAAMARWELQRGIDLLHALRDEQEKWTVIEECGDVRKRLVGAIKAIDAAICAAEGVSVPAASIEEETKRLEESLEIRQSYAILRRILNENAAAGTEHLRRSLRNTALAISQLVDGERYSSIRVADRVSLRRLNERLQAWLAQPTDDLAEGTRLLEEIRLCSELLLEINRRGELTEHDLTVATEVYETLYGSGAPPEELPLDVLSRLEALAGRDEEMDELLFGDRPAPTEAWRPPLERFLRIQRVESAEALSVPAELGSRRSEPTPTYV